MEKENKKQKDFIVLLSEFINRRKDKKRLDSLVVKSYKGGKNETKI